MPGSRLLCAAAAVAVLLAAPFARAADDFLDPDDAFRISARLDADAGRVRVDVVVADGYHLYADSVAVRSVTDGVTVGALERPQGVVRYDEALKKPREQYAGTVAFAAPVAGPAGPVEVEIDSQGCADAGLCYPPTTKRVALELPRSIAAAGAQGAVAGQAGQAAELDRIASTLASGSLWSIALLFAGLGALLSLTPCVLPMVPILSAIIVGQGTPPSRGRGLALSASYSLGMAVVYTSMGVAAGLAGEGLAAALQQPWVLATFAGLLFLLALSMFDVYALQMPGSIQSRLQDAANGLPGGRLASVFVMGGVSSMIVGPCVAAPLAGALVYIGQTRDVVAGGVALFAMSAGMSLPLLACGVSAGSLLPRAGAWMDGVKRFFGVLLIGVAIWMVSPVLPPAATMLAWGTLAVLCAVWLGVLDPLPADARGTARLAKGVGAVLAIAGVAQLAGAMGGGRDPMQPLAAFGPGGAVAASLPARGTEGVQAGAGREGGEGAAFRRISASELDRRVATAGRPVVVDFYADWCVACKEMERFSFAHPEVSRELGRFERLQVDVTTNGEAERALMKRFGLFGPPALVFFDARGEALPSSKLIGYVEPKSLAPHLRRLQ